MGCKNANIVRKHTRAIVEHVVPGDKMLTTSVLHILPTTSYFTLRDTFIECSAKRECTNAMRNIWLILFRYTNT